MQRIKKTIAGWPHVKPYWYRVGIRVVAGLGAAVLTTVLFFTFGG